MGRMHSVVVDTNVWIMAHVSQDKLITRSDVICANACVKWLNFLKTDERLLAVDDAWKILKSYREYLNATRSATNSVAQDVLEHLERTGRFLRVPIIYDSDGYAILPSELGLDKFDRDDRKFVAVVLGCDENDRPPIVNATDSDWAESIDLLMAAGIMVEELCPEWLEGRREELRT
jgi:hypothetical protein